MTDTDVLVVGAGPTGLALACALRLRGIDVTVVDAAPGPAVTSRANFVHARGSQVLDRLGALGTLPDESVRAMRITTYLGDRPLMRLRFGDPGLRTAAPPMVVSQARVERELRDRLAALGRAPQWDTALESATADADGVTARLSTGREVRARWLVGCDGTSSTTRRLAGIPAPGVRLSERFLLADVRLDWDLDRSGTTGWIHADGMLGAMPMPDHRPGEQPGEQPGEHGRDDLWRLIAYDPATAPGQQAPRTRLTEDQIAARVREILPRRSGRPDVTVLETEWLSEFTIHRRLADTYRSGRVLLAGDAAHAHAPFGGQGMLTGLGDAENLGWKLSLVVRGQAGDALLDTYEAERRPLATDVLRGTSTVTKVNVARGPVGRFVRDRVIVRLFNQAWLQRWVTYTTSQLWVSYRRGPLGSGPGTRLLGRRPRPGDPVGDLPCARGDGTPTRLHAELRGRWALLAPPGTASPGAGPAGSALGDDLVVLRHADRGTARDAGRRPRHRGEAWLVRPDGHLAWRGTDPRALDDRLRAALRPGGRR